MEPLTKEEYDSKPFDWYETDPRRLWYEFPEDEVLKEMTVLYYSYHGEPWYSMDKDTMMLVLKQIRMFARARYKVLCNCAIIPPAKNKRT